MCERIGDRCAQCPGVMIDTDVCATFRPMFDDFAIAHHPSGAWVELPRARMLTKVIGTDARDPEVRAELIYRTRHAIELFAAVQRVRARATAV